MRKNFNTGKIYNVIHYNLEIKNLFSFGKVMGNPVDKAVDAENRH